MATRCKKPNIAKDFLKNNPDVAKKIDELGLQYSKDIQELLKDKDIDCTLKISFAFTNRK